VAATEAGTRAARTLDDLYRRHAGEVYRYAYGVLGNHADAEDVTQTTFVNALRALERGERVRKPGNWLLVIAHNVVRQRWRRELARPTEVELDRDVPSTPQEDAALPLDELVRALQRIPPAQREALVMRELEGRSYREIADILDLTPSALETLLFRARRSLAEELENVVTCEHAERAMSTGFDGRLSRKERRRLDEHLRDCPQCARLAAVQRRHRTVLRGLAVLPLPLSLAFWKGAPSAAAGSVPAIGLGSAAGATAAAATGAGTGATTGGLLLGGGMAVKAAAVVAAVGVTAGVSVEGARRVADDGAGRRPPAVANDHSRTGGPEAKVPPGLAVSKPARAKAASAKAARARAAQKAQRGKKSEVASGVAQTRRVVMKPSRATNPSAKDRQRPPKPDTTPRSTPAEERAARIESRVPGQKAQAKRTGTGGPASARTSGSDRRTKASETVVAGG
jgi:RNA polymerase sigma factor (sigma-70 family)